MLLIRNRVLARLIERVQQCVRKGCKVGGRLGRATRFMLVLEMGRVAGERTVHVAQRDASRCVAPLKMPLVGNGSHPYDKWHHYGFGNRSEDDSR